MHRNVRIGRAGLWAAVASGPVALAVALMPAPAVVPAGVAQPASRTVAQPSQDPSGYAELFVSSWLRSSAHDEESAQSRRARAMAPDVALPEQAPVAQSRLEGVRSVRSARDGRSRVVTVAAQYANGTVRYLAVKVATGAGGGTFTVDGPPAVVAGPSAGTATVSAFRVNVPSGALSSTAAEFLRSYLTGVGEVDRYLAPGTTLSGLAAGSFTAVEVEEVLSADEAGAGAKVPADGTRARVEVAVTARVEGGAAWPLRYELTLTARDGRWEIASLDSAAATPAGGAR
ncbi:conjugal transfer protein [Streptomyces sp. NPDC095817]|uniref:conjugal transfer protein n=1 Tax=Streptomyces sp. NPDC095817 TaxID=3155082 RepID=UPI00331A91EB